VQLDQTRIAIRERGFLEIADLALRVIRAHGGRLTAAWLVGVAPVIAVDTWFLEYLRTPSGSGDELIPLAWLALWLAVWQLPLATAGITLYVGEALFVERPSARRLWKNFFGALGQMLWYQVVVRGVLVLPVVTAFLLFTSWPYASEVILLERNRMFRRRGQRDDMTSGRRIRRLHAGFSGELFGRWLAALGFGGVLVFSVVASLVVVLNQLFGPFDNELDPAAPLLWILLGQVGLWLVLGYFAVVRYLCYLDLRIRREGWEIELLLRAEGDRLARRQMGAPA